MSTHLIVGAGQAGAAAALQMRRSGFEGRVVLLGEEAHPPYERPPLSKAVLTDGVPVLPRLGAPDAYEAAGVELLTGTAVAALDLAAKEVALTDGRRLAFDRLLLATGGRARVLGLPGGQSARVLRNFDDALALRKKLSAGVRVAVIGAGVIGLEVASSARALGCEVTVLEATARPMGRLLAAALSDFLTGVHASAGVALHFGVRLQGIEASPDGRFSIMTDRHLYEADLVVAGIGMQPNSELAAAAGLAVSDAIDVDEFGRTSAPDVFACGDAAAFWQPSLGRRVRQESWQHATRHAVSVARNMCADSNAYAELPWSWTDQHGINVQMLGDTARSDGTLVRGSTAARSFVALHVRDGRAVGATLVNQGREMRPCKRLIESGWPVDAARWADTTFTLRSLAEVAA